MLNSILNLSIRNRWLVVIVTLAVGAAGIVSLLQLPIDAVPDITNNQVQINTLVPALSPEEIEREVTYPIETSLAGTAGLQQTRSLSRNGFSQVTAIFRDDVDINLARSLVRERLTEARATLPREADPALGPITTGLGEIYMWSVAFAHPGGKNADVVENAPGWQSDGSYLTPEGQRLANDVERGAYLRTIEDWVIRPQLQSIENVAGIDAQGGYEKQYQVQPDPARLVSYGLSLRDLTEALEKNNANRGAGFIEHQGDSFPVRIAGKLKNAEQAGEVVIGLHGQTPVRVKDVAVVTSGAELRFGTASEHGREAVIGTVMMTTGANSRTVAAAVDAKMPDIRRSLPPDVIAQTIYNRRKLVNATIATVGRNLVEGAALVTVLLLILLGNARAAVITALAIPLAMLATATGMVMSHVSGNLLSLGAIDFGIIVDGSVIIVENCLVALAARQHALRRTLTPPERLTAVYDATRQVRGAAAFGEAIIIIVYLPILALTGVEGKMFHPMALTVIFALAAAFVLSLTFIPAMVAICLVGPVGETESILIRLARRAYEPVVRMAVAWRWVVIPSAVVAFVGSLLLFTTLGQEFLPTLDEGDVDVSTSRQISASLTDSTRMQFDIEQTLEKLPQVERVFSKTGTAELASDPMPPGRADTFVILKPREQWPQPLLSKDALIDQMDKALADVPGTNYEFTQPIQDRFNDLLAGVKGDVAIKIYCDAFATALPPAQQIARLLADVPGAADVKVSQTRGLPILTVTPDAVAMSRYGLSVSDISDIVATAVGGQEVGSIDEGDRRYPLVVRLPDALRENLDALATLPVPLPRGDAGAASDASSASVAQTLAQGPAAAAYVPLSAVAKIQLVDGLNEVERENGKRRVTITCNVRGRDIGSFVADAQRVVAQVQIPPGSWIDWGGQFQNLLAARRRLAMVVPACLALIFLLLVFTFHSFRDAILVFTGVPLALIGGVVALWLRDIPFSISAAVGFIALSGVAVLNGIVMVTFIKQAREGGAPLEEAIFRGSLARLRPVLTTALVASLGFIPMALAHGTGAEVQRPLATVVIGGIISSTILTLVILPSLYRAVHSARQQRPHGVPASRKTPALLET